MPSETYLDNQPPASPQDAGDDTLDSITAGEMTAIIQSLITDPNPDIQILPGRLYMRQDSEELVNVDPGGRFMNETEILNFALGICEGTTHYQTLKNLQVEREKSIADRHWLRPKPFNASFEVDNALGVTGRFRAQIYFSYSPRRSDFGLSLTIRRILPFIFSLEEMVEMGLSPGLETFVRSLVSGQEKNGLVLIFGETETGKSTTLASILHQMNCHCRKQSRNVITIEDPIEYVYSDDRLRFIQVEIGRHVETMSEALHSMLRQNPNIVVIGEIRDAETAREALHAAGTGHLVLATCHGPSASKGLVKYLKWVDDDYASVSGSLVAVIAQKRIVLDTEDNLAESLDDITSLNSQNEVERFLPEPQFRTLLTEIMRPKDNPEIKKLFSGDRKPDSGLFYRAMRSPGMETLEDTFEGEIIKLMNSGRISQSTALAVAEEKHVIEAAILAGKK